VLVAANAAHDDVVLLAALERVDRGDLDLLVQVLLERAVELHVRHDVRALTLVRRDDADLAREDAGLEEPGDDLLDVGRLGAARARTASASARQEGRRRERGRERETHRLRNEVPLDEISSWPRFW